MPSVWIRNRTTPSGARRHRVEYQLGGRGSRCRYGGQFKTKREALLRKQWIAGELAAMRVPDLTLLREPELAPTFTQAVDAWCDSRIDVTDGTRDLHRIALNRALPILGPLRVDEIEVEDLIEVVTSLAEAGRKRSTIKKTIKYSASVLDENGRREVNPARDPRIRFPHEEYEELTPPPADHVAGVFRLLATEHRLALLWLDWSGARVGSIDTLQVADYDEPRQRVRLRRSVTKNRQPLWVELPDVLAEAITASLPPREDRDPVARLFASPGSDALRTAIGRACRALGIPLWSPHDLRHRRISLLHHQGRSLAEVARFVGQRKLSLTADTYTHVLSDGAEVDYAELLAA